MFGIAQVAQIGGGGILDMILTQNPRIRLCTQVQAVTATMRAHRLFGRTEKELRRAKLSAGGTLTAASVSMTICLLSRSTMKMTKGLPSACALITV